MKISELRQMQDEFDGFLTAEDVDVFIKSDERPDL
ncbi:hypothetical protein [Salmonella phage GSW6]|uniref:Uncharacterized protein n=1 Tax=Salmonella phage GSW6 TaxID=3025422 RepID=A0AAE9YFH2_9CAUD|nr:hypothetical protein [Salmonella phage GSW6]